jgi:hypothetical protein
VVAESLIVPARSVVVQNAGSKAVTALSVAFHYDHSLYRIKQSVLTIPLVIPVRMQSMYSDYDWFLHGSSSLVCVLG